MPIAWWGCYMGWEVQLGTTVCWAPVLDLFHTCSCRLPKAAFVSTKSDSRMEANIQNNKKWINRSTAVKAFSNHNARRTQKPLFFSMFRLHSSHLGVLKIKNHFIQKWLHIFPTNILPGPFGPRCLEWFSTLWQLPPFERVLRWGIFGRPPRTAAWHRPLRWWVYVTLQNRGGLKRSLCLNHPKQPGV